MTDVRPHAQLYYHLRGSLLRKDAAAFCNGLADFEAAEGNADDTVVTSQCRDSVGLAGRPPVWWPRFWEA